MEQQIRFCTTSDGVTIAYSIIGEGDPFLWTPGWLSHLELNLVNSVFRDQMESLIGRGRQIILFDGRGTGLSDREVEDLSVSARVRDIEAVVRHLGLTSFVLFGWSMTGPPAIIYAAENAEKVSHLILHGTYARNFGQEREDVCRALLALMRAEWGIGSKTVGEFSNPDADREAADRTAKYFRQAATVDVATSLLEEGMFGTDITEYLPRVTMPTLVMHRREDNAVNFECGRRMAALIPNARFVPLPGSAHPPFDGDVEPLLRAVFDFLSVSEVRPSAKSPAALVTILFTDIESSTALTQRLGDAKAQELLRTHNNIVRDALKAHSGTEVKHTGDGIMASFPTASGALECAVAIQKGVAAHVEEQPETPLGVRIGLNAGEPVAEEQDLFGTAVQLAKRVCDRAEPGEILVSNVVRELAAGKGFLFSDHGDVELRGFEDPARLYEVRWQG